MAENYKDNCDSSSTILEYLITLWLAVRIVLIPLKAQKCTSGTTVFLHARKVDRKDDVLRFILRCLLNHSWKPRVSQRFVFRFIPLYANDLYTFVLLPAVPLLRRLAGLV